MILILANTNNSYYISNEVRFKLIYSWVGLGAIGLHTKSFYYLIDILTFINNKANIYIRPKF